MPPAPLLQRSTTVISPLSENPRSAPEYEGTLCATKEVHALLLQYAQSDDLQKIKDDFLGECQIWSTLRHPCVVQFLGSVITDCFLMIMTNFFRSVLSHGGPVQITCYGNGEDVA